MEKDVPVELCPFCNGETEYKGTELGVRQYACKKNECFGRKLFVVDTKTIHR